MYLLLGAEYFYNIKENITIIFFQVRWVQQQHEKVRKKRDYATDLNYPRLSNYGGLLRNVAPQTRVQYRDTGVHNIFPDPLFKEQWYLVSRVCVEYLFYVCFAFWFAFWWCGVIIDVWTQWHFTRYKAGHLLLWLRIVCVFVAVSSAYSIWCKNRPWKFETTEKLFGSYKNKFPFLSV